MVEVDPIDLWTLYLCTVRYSLGRQSYMPGVCQHLLLRHAGQFTVAQLDQIASEVNEALHAAETSGALVGEEVDHRTWRQVVLAATRIAKARANA